MKCTDLCQEIQSLLELSGGPLREARYRAVLEDSSQLLTIAADLGRARQYLTDAHASAHAQCLYPNLASVR